MTDTQVTWLTQEAHDRLKAELDQLKRDRLGEEKTSRDKSEWKILPGSHPAINP